MLFNLEVSSVCVCHRQDGNNIEDLIRVRLADISSGGFRHVLELNLVGTSLSLIVDIDVWNQLNKTVQDVNRHRRGLDEVLRTRQLALRAGLSSSTGDDTVLHVRVLNHAVHAVENRHDMVGIVDRSLLDTRSDNVALRVNAFFSHCRSRETRAEALIQCKAGKVNFLVINLIRHECPISKFCNLQPLPRFLGVDSDANFLEDVLHGVLVRVNRIRLSNVHVLLKSMEVVAVELLVRLIGNLHAVDVRGAYESERKVRLLSASRARTADEVDTRIQGAHGDAAYINRVRNIIAIGINDTKFDNVVLMSVCRVVEQTNHVNKRRILCDAVVKVQLQSASDNSVISFNQSLTLLCNSCTLSRLVNSDALRTIRVVITEIALLLQVAGEHARNTKFVLAFHAEVEILVDVFATDAAGVNRTATTVPSIVDTSYEIALLLLFAVIDLAKDITGVFLRVDWHDTSGRSVERSTDD